MIKEPMFFEEAIRFLLDKEQLPAEWDASMWTDQEPDFRTKAFWSAKVENARFLDRSQGLLFDYMTKVTDQVVGPDGVTRPALRVAGREHFVKLMRDFMITEGMAKHEEFKDVNQKDVTDIRSLARLRLIFDTNIRQAYGFGQWKQGMTPAVLRAFPAARLIRDRDRGVKEPRPRHQYNLGEVLLKTDRRWAEFHNAKDIGGFGVPWGPYGFNSGVTQEDVDSDEARALGLNVDSVAPVPAKITDGTQASTKGMDPALKAKLLAELRAEPSTPGKTPEDYAREAAADTRRIMLNRGLTDAVSRGDSGKAAKYRKAIAELPETRLEVREVGEKIVLESGGGAGIVPTDEPSSHIQETTREMGPHKEPDDRAIALNVRAASRAVLSEWSVPESDASPGSVADRAIEAQITAANQGRKPLYYEPWGDPELCDQLATEYRKVLDPGVTVESRNGFLYIFRPGEVKKIMDSDPAFYRRVGESDFDSVTRVSEDHSNGELLGYGARDMMTRPAHAVKIFKGDELVLYYFVSDPDPMHASRFAKMRAEDFEMAFGWDDVGFTIEKMD